MPTFPMPFNTVLEVVARAIEQVKKNEEHKNWKEKIKLSANIILSI